MGKEKVIIKEILFPSKYKLDGLNQLKRVATHRILNRYTDHSNNAKYTYKRKRILEETPSYKPVRGVIIIETKHKNKIITLFNKNKISYKTFNTSISNSMLH